MHSDPFFKFFQDQFDNEDGDQEAITVEEVLKSVTKSYNEEITKKIKAAASKKDVPEVVKLLKEVIDAEGTKKCHACERSIQLGEQYNEWTAEKLLCIPCAKKLDLEIAPSDTRPNREATIDDLIGLMQTGTTQLPADLPEVAKKVLKITSDEGDTVEVKLPHKQPGAKAAKVPAPSTVTVTTPEKTVKKPGQPLKVTPKSSETINTGGVFSIPLSDWGKFTDLTVYTNADTQAMAMSEFSSPLPVKRVFMSYNVAMATVVNGRDEPIRVYFVNGYEDFTSFLLSPGAKIKWGFGLDEKMKHIVQVSAKADEIEDFSFLKTWMPI
jgi:hypothetical protein